MKTKNEFIREREVLKRFIDLGAVHGAFQRNTIAILAEERIALQIMRPEAFVKGMTVT